MERNNRGLIILVAAMAVLILGLGGYLAYDKVLKNRNDSVNTNKGNSLSGTYAYYGVWNNVADLHVELELYSNNTFALSLGYASSGGYFTGAYTIDGNRLTLNATLRDASNADFTVTVSQDTFDCIYNKSNDTITLNKWNYNYIDGGKLMKETKTDYNGTLNRVNSFKYF